VTGHSRWPLHTLHLKQSLWYQPPSALMDASIMSIWRERAESEEEEEEEA